MERGDSGSPIWNETLNAITGMLVARQKGRLRCYGIPLRKIVDAFGEDLPTLNDSIQDDYLSRSDLAFLEEIIQSIESDLNQSPRLKEEITKWLEVPTDKVGRLNRYLVERCKQGDLVTVIQALESAMVDCIDAINASETNRLDFNQIFKVADGLISKLVLFNIHDDWMHRYRAQAIANSRILELPKLDLSSIEIVTSRHSLSLPKFEIESNGKIAVGGKGVVLESGAKGQGAVFDILKQLYLKIKKDASSYEIRNFGEDEINILRTTIEQRQNHRHWKLREKYYLVIAPDEGSSLADPEVKSELLRLIPQLQWITLKSETDQEMLITNDIELMVAIESFFKTLESYKSNG